jgi:hypothetical protein
VRSYSAVPLNNDTLDFVAGWSQRFKFELERIAECEIPMTDATSGIGCEDSSYVVEYENGTEIESGTIASGGSAVIVVPNPTTCDDATAVLKDTNGTTISTTNIPSGDTEDIEAPDATYEVKYADNTPIENGSIVSGGSKVVVVPNPIVCEDAIVNINSVLWANVPAGDIENISVRQSTGTTEVGSKQGQYFRIADSTAVLKTSGGATISTTPIKAEESEDVVAPDGTVNVNKSDSTLISAVTVASGGVEPYNVADSKAVVKNTAGTIQSTKAIKATESEDVVAPDATLTLNGGAFTTALSGVTTDIELVDQLDAPIVPDSVVGKKITVTLGGGAPVGATLMKTGQTTSYRTGDDGDLEAGRATDFFTLASNNPFGNTNRFTDELGGQTYTDNIVIDWSTYDGATVLGYYRVSNGVNINWNDAIDAALLVSIGTFTSGWRLPNRNEINSLMIMDSLRGLNYAPFNNNSNDNYWSSTTAHPSTSNAYYIPNGTKNVLGTPKTQLTGYRYIPCRTFTVTGTTLT